MFLEENFLYRRLFSLAVLFLLLSAGTVIPECWTKREHLCLVSSFQTSQAQNALVVATLGWTGIWVSIIYYFNTIVLKEVTTFAERV